MKRWSSPRQWPNRQHSLLHNFSYVWLQWSRRNFEEFNIKNLQGSMCYISCCNLKGVYLCLSFRQTFWHLMDWHMINKFLSLLLFYELQFWQSLFYVDLFLDRFISGDAYLLVSNASNWCFTIIQFHMCFIPLKFHFCTFHKGKWLMRVV